MGIQEGYAYNVESVMLLRVYDFMVQPFLGMEIDVYLLTIAVAGTNGSFIVSLRVPLLDQSGTR